MPRLFACALALLLAAGGAAHARSRPRATAKKKDPPRFPAVTLEHLTTHESFVLRPDKLGRLGAKQLGGIRRFLRCHHTGRVHAIAERLPRLLYTVAQHFGARTIEVVAGYRAPRIAREKGNPRSPHKQGLACDFRIDGVELTTLRDYVRSAFDKVGVGYYPNSGFVHLDVGRKRNAFWIDYSGPGQRAQYSSDPDGDIKSGRADGGAPPQPGEAAPPDDADDDPAPPTPSLPQAPGADPD